MTRKLLAAALVCLLLAGCTGAAPAAKIPDRLVPTKETENDTLRQIKLTGAECRFFAFGADLLLLYALDGNSTLLRIDGRTLKASASCPLGAGSWQIQATQNAVLCYEEEGAAVLRNDDLSERMLLSLPAHAAPLLGDGNEIFCAEGTKLLSYKSELPRTLRDEQSADCQPTALYQGQLVCTNSDRSQLIFIEDGHEIAVMPPVLASAKLGSRDCLALRVGRNDCLYLGNAMLPLPPGWKFVAFLEPVQSVLLYHEGTLGIYDLTTGSRTASVASCEPFWAAMLEDGKVYFQVEPDSLYQWSPEYSPVRDNRIRLTAVSTSESPDPKSLELCRQRAGFLEEQYGLHPLLYTDALRALPGSAVIEPEHLAPILLDTLDRIEKALSRFPAGFVRQVLQDANRTYLCPVRCIQIDGETVSHFQVWSGQDSFLYIEASEDAGNSIIRALYAMMESKLLSASDALDKLDSTTSDRAGLLLTAMEQNNREIFSSAILQNELRTLSRGLRQVYEITGSPPWEQYLW